MSILVRSTCGLIAASLLTAALGAAPASAQPTEQGIPRAEASALFAEARAICERDHGVFWGRSLCGPILLVDPDSHAVVANRPDANGQLKREGDLYVGTMAANENVANTPSEWSGAYWTELVWPLLPKDQAVLHVMVAHEMFHRIQRDLHLTSPDGDNGHLDSLEGRYLLQLEWRALAKAIEAKSPAARRRVALDALAFRAERYRLFPKAASNEHSLELNEGVAEYTGVRLGLVGAEAQRAHAVRDLSAHIGDRTFVRSFAYATGPAYGLLLDRYAPGWRKGLKSGGGFDGMLRAALKARPDGMALEARAARYDGAALRASEVERDRKRQALLATLRARFIQGPVLRIPARKVSYEFNPSTLQPLDAVGTVYPHIRISGDFGRLEADNGALLAPDFSAVTVSLTGADLKALKGDGWVLTLKPGWTLKPGPRDGDWTATPPTP